jgi:competence protein ComEC
VIQVLVAAAIWASLAFYRMANGLDTHFGSVAPDFIWPFDEIRSSFANQLLSVTPDAGALVAGLSIGDDSLLSQSLADDMKSVGITHLTAVSGANCAIVIALVYLLLKRLSFSRWLRTSLAVLALIAYVLLVGPEPSVLRSSFMAATVLIVIAMGRSANSLAALSFAVLVLLIISPDISTSFGFALSVLATAGILTLAPELLKRLKQKMPTWLAMPIAVSLGAQITCWPVLLLLSGGLQTYSLFANLLVEPLVAPITVLGLIACLLALPLPWLSSAFSFVASVFAWPITVVAHWLAHLPFTTLNWPEGLLGICLAALVVSLTFAALRNRKRRARAISAALLALVGSVFLGSNAGDVVRSSTWMSGDWQLVACDVGQGDALVIRSSNSVALIDVGREDGPIDKCLSDLQLTKLDLVVLTHFDQDHVGGIAGALEARSVSAVLITDFQDTRPTVKYVMQQLQDRGLSPIRAYRGLSGELGDASWRVLSPHQGAPEAEDSNDGSVTMVFDSPNYHLITLADLGERGQMRLAVEMGEWMHDTRPTIMKVSHHGSADQYAEFIEHIKPDFALISVGKRNSYGHPTARTLELLRRAGSRILRTDEFGSIALSFERASQGSSQTSDLGVKIQASG